jgi:hypothetical protein
MPQADGEDMNPGESDQGGGRVWGSDSLPKDGFFRSGEEKEKDY